VAVRPTVLMVSKELVGVGSAAAARARVHDHLIEARYAMEQRVMHFMGDGVRLGHRQSGVDQNFDFGVQAMTDPAQPQRLHGLDTLDIASDDAGMFDERSAASNPSATPTAPIRTPSEVSPSVVPVRLAARVVTHRTHENICARALDTERRL
jgi:hypothetical protein